MKYSHQREIILQTVQEERSHLTAQEVYEIVRKKVPNISLGTVYRNLNILSENGLIRKIELPQSSDQFDFTLKPHSHLYCTKCNKIYDINIASIEEMKHIIEQEHGYTITSCNIVLEGLCKNCQVEKKEGM